jgi:hypothetical protein
MTAGKRFSVSRVVIFLRQRAYYSYYCRVPHHPPEPRRPSNQISLFIYYGTVARFDGRTEHPSFYVFRKNVSICHHVTHSGLSALREGAE